jgi:hypothetical protein
MDPELKAALAAAARKFADVLDPAPNVRPTTNAVPMAGTAHSMLIVLGGVAEINDEQKRGANSREMAAIARKAGMDPRGMAGYYTTAAQLLELKNGGRWVTKLGRKRLAQLQADLGMPPAA